MFTNFRTHPFRVFSAFLFGAAGLVLSLSAADDSPIKETETRAVSGYLLNNNVWGKAKSPGGWELIDVVKPGEKLSWSVRYNWPVGSDRYSVKCYPSVVTGWQWGLWSTDGRLPRPIASLRHVVSGAAVQVVNPGVQNVAYDLWFHGPAPVKGDTKPTDELMIWTGRYGGAGPLGKKPRRSRLAAPAGASTRATLAGRSFPSSGKKMRPRGNWM